MKYPKLIVTEKDEEHIMINKNVLIEIMDGPTERLYAKDGTQLIWVENHGDFLGRAFVLNPHFKWFIGKDKYGTLLLVPVKEESEEVEG